MANLSAARAAGRPPASKIIFWNALSAGKTFDMRDLGQALDHWHDGPAHDRGGPLAKLKRVTAVWRWVQRRLAGRRVRAWATQELDQNWSMHGRRNRHDIRCRGGGLSGSRRLPAIAAPSRNPFPVLVWPVAS